VSTINHVRLARISPAFARECEGEHQRREPGHRFGPEAEQKLDPYTRRSNICPTCHTARAMSTGECFCP
jgi:hypothetical protein